MSDVGSLVALLPHESEDTEEDPETHATAREFVDYTEYLPSDIRRSIELLQSLHEQYDYYTAQLQTLTKEFRTLQAELPVSNGFARTVTDKELELRLRISRAMNAALRARQESTAESIKMHQNVDRHYSRAVAIRSKLDEITIPSRDPTPVSPRKPRVKEKPDDQHYKITLRLNNERTPAQTARGGGRRRNYNPTPRSRQPPPTPANNEDDWEDMPDTVAKPKKKKPTAGTIKRGPKPPTDPPFSGGAQARYEDGTPIPSHLLPWNRLTNEELARLRKRMKKNAGWTPSVTMIIRELESLGRGPKHKDMFTDQTEGHLGEDFLKIYGPEDGGIGDPEKIAPDDGEGVRENKGMRLNRAKKRKREEERKEKEREAERERQEREAEAENVRKAEEEERKEKERLMREARERAAREAAEREAAAAAAVERERLAREAREEKLREEKAREKAAVKEKERAAAIVAASSRKMRSASISTGTTASTSTTTASVEASSTEDADEDMPDVDADAPLPRRLGRPPKNPPTFKPGHKRAASTTTPAGADPKRSKRDLAAPAPAAAPTTARKKGLMGRGTRKKPTTPGDEEGAEEEWVDDDEEDLNRYCLCDEVSRGTMVACENSQCPKVWFHIECVGLKEEEATTKAKWFCPLCSENSGKRGAGKRRTGKKV
ncbi:uncharacterized protein LAJ45_02812 [Morchella importuna]|uniref:uncharacterized protein n=1 Tax=Morchella importuna TaxID=1174673 RepID=UPI001E8D341C|nr:uncharacterized protein LAJ45_02812 [Morchella importuna]KAH8153225.1 hypothetical protein LAJ45_02812 [Morchella importuna]